MGQGIGDATQALGWALAWSRCAEHPLRSDRLRPTTRAVSALARAVAIVASWGPTPAADQFADVNVGAVADFMRLSADRGPAGWFVSERKAYHHLRALMPGIDSLDTFRRRLIDAPATSDLGELRRARTDRGFPAEAVIAFHHRLSR